MVSSKFNIPAVLVGLLLAIPALAAPAGNIEENSLKAEDIIPREYIDQVLAYHEAKRQVEARAEWRNAKRALHALQKRVPVDNHCEPEDEWVSRRCTSDISAQAYEDECQTPDGDEYTEPGHCPQNTVCQDIEIPNGTDPGTGEEIFIDDILCVPSTPPRQDNISRKRQYGYRSVTASSSKKQIVSIPVLVDNPTSSVSASILGNDRSFDILPASTLTANLRGFQLNLCEQEPTNQQKNSRMCIPKLPNHNLRNGQFIDFTFGLSGLQEGFFFYSIA
ncbi:hypothetical protein yc1106_00065 [Curvularia clavata]|uniref:Uncharacterized protein n=1 Tax=Curvularia clavata TaxID=95742 RepID=A0A9Q8YZ62_CURCL|nr:hypothetical protein yc1106_00065 [Curvularia clavata]